MPTNINAIKKTTPKTHFFKPVDFYENDVVFTITSCESKNGRYGKQWVMTIELPEDNVDDTQVGENDVFVLSMGGGNRDAMMAAIRESIHTDGPAYNCFINAVTQEGFANPTYSIEQLEPGDEGYVEPPTGPTDVTPEKTTATVLLSSKKKIKRSTKSDDAFLD